MSQNKVINLNTKQGYDLWSNSYDRKTSSTVIAAREVFCRLKPILIGKRILEIGCGTGANFELLVEDGIESAIGIDLSEGMLRQARAKKFPFKTDFIQHDINQGVPLQSSSIDFVIMSLVLEHLKDMNSVFREISRVLSPGGRALIVELHPYMTRIDGFARFYEESSNDEYRMESKGYSASDFINTHLENGLRLDQTFEYFREKDSSPLILAAISTCCY